VSRKVAQPDRVVIAVDPHKASWTAAAIGQAAQALAAIRVPVSQQGYRDLRQFARRWPGATWASGIGDLTAGKILARVGDVARFRSAAAFASYTGTAPIEVSSGDVVRHRLSRAGDRQLNCCLHTMAISQIQRDCPGRDYYLRKRAAGKGHKEAMRCLKRRLSDLVYRQLVRDTRNQLGTGPGGQMGATLPSSAAGSTPTAGSSDKSLPGPVSTDPTTSNQDRLD
jgi:transposase